MKQIKDILIEKIQLRQKQKEIFEKVEVGDILWCSMPLSKRELRSIEMEHRIRPYLIVKKEAKFLLCYQSSSKHREQLNNCEEYCINNEKYRNRKSSWIDLTGVKKIKIKDIQSEFIKLNQIDIKKIEKRICIGQNKGNNQLIRFNEAIYIEEGDIVTKDERTYYVYAGDNANIYGFKIQKKRKQNKKLKEIKVNSKTYYTDFKELIAIKRNEYIKVTNIAYKEEMLLILEQKKELKANTYSKIEEIMKRDNSKFEIGSVFQYGNSKVMYLYSNNHKYYGVDLLWYSIKPRVFEIKEIKKRRLIENKDLEEVNKVLEFLIEKNVKNNTLENIYQYVRNLLFSSITN